VEAALGRGGRPGRGAPPACVRDPGRPRPAVGDGRRGPRGRAAVPRRRGGAAGRTCARRGHHLPGRLLRRRPAPAPARAGERVARARLRHLRRGPDHVRRRRVVAGLSLGRDRGPRGCHHRRTGRTDRAGSRGRSARDRPGRGRLRRL
jgi:hypothetical protein